MQFGSRAACKSATTAGPYVEDSMCQHPQLLSTAFASWEVQKQFLHQIQAYGIRYDRNKGGVGLLLDTVLTHFLMIYQSLVYPSHCILQNTRPIRVACGPRRCFFSLIPHAQPSSSSQTSFCPNSDTCRTFFQNQCTYNGKDVIFTF